MSKSKVSVGQTRDPVHHSSLNIPLPDIPESDNEFDPELDMAEVEEPLVLGDEAPDLGAEPIDLVDPAVAVELSEDPVRLYLREIGQVKLLDADSEFRLSTMIEADRLVETLRQRPVRKGVDPATFLYRALLEELTTAWQRFGEDATRLQAGLPDLALVITEAQH